MASTTACASAMSAASAFAGRHTDARSQRPCASLPSFEGLASARLPTLRHAPQQLSTAQTKSLPQQRKGGIRCASLKELSDRIASVKNTQKITDAMKLVAAAKVRRAQEAVVNGRPFSENLVKVLFGVNQQLQVEGAGSKCNAELHSSSEDWMREALVRFARFGQHLYLMG